MVTKVLTNYARVLMFLEDLVSLPEDCGQNSVYKALLSWCGVPYNGYLLLVSPGLTVDPIMAPR